MPDHALFIIAVLAVCVVVSELLARKTRLRHLGTALIVIIVTAIVANVGVIPTSSGADNPVYGALFREVAWMSIFWLLLEVRLREIAKAGPRMIALFLIGALGTALGAIAGMILVGGAERFGSVHNVLAGMFTGTYTGGSTNFIAIASEYQLTDGALLASANAVDAAMTTVWMAVTIALPRFVGRWLSSRTSLAPARASEPAAPIPDDGVADDTETVHPIDLGIVLALGAFAVWGSDLVADWAAARLGVPVPGILVLTTLALLIAQVPWVARLRGARLLGLFGVYLFLAVIGALCDVEALRQSGGVGITLFLFVCIVFAVHGTITYGAAFLLRLDAISASVVSQANIGGSTSALALARSLGRADLVLPGILLGALGSAVGTYLGLAVVAILG